jgi:predicted ABC-type ATPase
MAAKQKKIVIIAGPNGAGKTTFAREFLPYEGDCPIFVNADLIAAGIAPFQPETVAFRAGRLMLQEIAHHAAEGSSFAFETTLSGKTYAPMIGRWRADGYLVTYKRRVDFWQLFDNSGNSPVILEEGSNP